MLDGPVPSATISPSPSPSPHSSSPPFPPSLSFTPSPPVTSLGQAARTHPPPPPPPLSVVSAFSNPDDPSGGAYGKRLPIHNPSIHAVSTFPIRRTGSALFTICLLETWSVLDPQKSAHSILLPLLLHTPKLYIAVSRPKGAPSNFRIALVCPHRNLAV
ncbi:hypothetical protein BZA05DRAFT_237036 [Tricharina praecox]|uniref:uncharacterized protein n=1 Tax=Tricharina praecox TaxID=43433 RepID=UPI002221052D|nr:uncharacterized protein BZA05DRAFT_237036 [Tricharina praecox]KAI5855319.1 hypothetical protein BZA05DRAFT_237036 [Tricharina praecox]